MNYNFVKYYNVNVMQNWYVNWNVTTIFQVESIDILLISFIFTCIFNFE